MALVTGSETTAEAIAAVFDDPSPSWVTLPPGGLEAPTQLREALNAFDAGGRPAAMAASRWLKNRALNSHTTARTRLFVTDRRVAGFYSLASAQVALSQRDRRRLGAEPVQVPATLVAWIAKSAEADVEGKRLLLHAAASARRVAALQATAVLVVDPFDEETTAMWRSRYGFRRSSDPVRRDRLWLPLRAFG